MTRMNKQNSLRRAMDKTLPGLEQDVWFEQRVLARIREPERGRRLPKRTVALALLALMLLLSATAVAAVLLSGREVVDEYAVPMASETAGDSYTVAQTLELVALAEENGIVLSENAKRSIDKMLATGEGYYKEELIMAIAKAEFGENPSAWTLEQQNWFDDVCVAIGFIPEKEKSMPDKGEDAIAWAIAIADAYIQETYGDASDLHNPSIYETTGVQYINGDVDGRYPGMYYSVDYVPLEGTPSALYAKQYWVFISEDGEILGDWVYYNLRSSYNAAYGDFYWEWSQETLRAYRNDRLQTAATPDTKQTLIQLELSSYPDIAPEAISREEAGRLALEALNIDTAEYWGAVYIGAEPNPVWKTVMRVGADCYTAEVDSITGEILNLQESNSYSGDIFLERTKEEAEPLYQEYLETVPSYG